MYKLAGYSSSSRSSIFVLLVMAASTCLLSACSKPLQPPSLVPMHEQQAARVEGSGAGAYSGIMDRLSTMTVNLYPGSNTQIVDSIANQGSPSKGVKVVLKGDALTFMSAPGTAVIRSIEYNDKGETQQTGQEELKFTDDGAGGLEATAPNFAYKRELQLLLQITAARGGEGDLKVFVTPMDKEGKSTVVESKHYRVLSENDSSNGTEGDADSTQ